MYWVDHIVLVHHVNKHKRPPCIISGAATHFARDCHTPEADMRTQNYMIFTQAEVNGFK